MSKARIRVLRPVIAAVAAVALLAGLSACAAAGEPAIDDYAGLPQGVSNLPDPSRLEPFAAWQQGGARMAITLFGSSGCPPVAERLTITSSNSVRVTVADIPKNTMCTQDMAPHTTVFVTPSPVTTTSDVSISVVGQPTITLPALRP